MDEISKIDKSYLFDYLIDNVSEYGLLLSNREGHIYYSNRGAQLILGYPREELIGMQACDIFLPEDRVLKVPEEERKRAMKEGYAPDDRWHLRKDGTRFWASGITRPVRNEAKETIGFSKIFRNLTLRKTTEDKLKHQNSELSRFAHTAAHDLQEPLRNIDAFVQLIQMKDNLSLDAESKDFLSKIRASTKTMHSVISDTLSYSELNASKVLFERTELNAVFDSALNNLTSLIHELNARITRTVLPELNVMPNQIERLFTNLIGNALKFRRETPPTVFVTVSKREKDYLFSVIDNGIGIPEKSFGVIFQEFHRLHSKSEFEGTGLGLSLCKKIVEGHGGKIWVESKEGVGSTFCFTLPIEVQFSQEITPQSE